LADLGRKVNADYIAQARIGRFGGNLTIKVELYNVGSGNLIGSFTGDSKDVLGLRSVMETKAPALFTRMSEISNVASGRSSEFGTSSSSNLLSDLHEKSDTNFNNGILIDVRNGQKYRAMKISNQTWMLENLNFNASGSKCYDNLEANCKKYGRLYNWNTAMKACPSGWHLPSKAEWDGLSRFVGGEKVTGKHLKAKSGWNDVARRWRDDSSGNGQDTYGFAALPGGGGYSNGSFYYVGSRSHWWSSNESSSDRAYGRRMHHDRESANWDNTEKSHLFSVRCVKD
jgi:uncharacterized protein (TIGR02145 family)